MFSRCSYTTERNRKEQASLPSQPRYGAGRSQFYAEASRGGGGGGGAGGGEAGARARPADRTLYLSKSTFYDDRPPSPRPCRAPLCMYYGSAANDDYCSRCARLQ